MSKEFKNLLNKMSSERRERIRKKSAKMKNLVNIPEHIIEPEPLGGFSPGM